LDFPSTSEEIIWGRQNTRHTLIPLTGKNSIPSTYTQYLIDLHVVYRPSTEVRQLLYKPFACSTQFTYKPQSSLSDIFRLDTSEPPIIVHYSSDSNRKICGADNSPQAGSKLLVTEKSFKHEKNKKYKNRLDKISLQNHGNDNIDNIKYNYTEMNQIQRCNQSGGFHNSDIKDNMVECDQHDVEFVSEKQADYEDMNSSAYDHDTYQVTIIQNSTDSDSEVEVVLDSSKGETILY